MSEPEAKLVALATLTRETRSSIEVTKGTRDEYRWSIKRYYDETDESAKTIALAEIAYVDEQLRATFRVEE